MLKRTMLCIIFLLLCAVAHAEGQKVDIPIGNSPTMGPADAPITIIEFIDFQ